MLWELSGGAMEDEEDEDRDLVLKSWEFFLLCPVIDFDVKTAEVVDFDAR